MSIRRDYSQPLFGSRDSPFTPRRLFVIGLLLGAALVLLFLRRDQAQRVTQEWLGVDPTATPFASDYAAWGLERYQSGDIAGALELLAEAVRLRPDDVDYLYEYGVLLIENDRAEDAVPVADHALQVAPNDPRGYALKGRALMWDDPETAIQITILGQDVDPNFAPLYAAQGVAYTRLGRWNEGVRQGLRAIELAPNDLFALRSIYTPLVYVGRYQDAIDYLWQAISINPNLTAPYFELAALYRYPNPVINDPETALALYDEILRLEPDNAKAYLRICETRANVPEARFDEAQPYCDRAIELDPEYGDAYVQRGRMQYLRRNYESAIESFEAGIQYGSTAIECWYLRGLALYYLGYCDDAWEVLQESRNRAQAQGIGETTLANIEIGLGFITRNCPGYSQLSVPTALPPTPIPPTPIGGFGP